MTQPQPRKVSLGQPLSDEGDFAPDLAGAEALLRETGTVRLVIDPEMAKPLPTPATVDALALWLAEPDRDG